MLMHMQEVKGKEEYRNISRPGIQASSDILMTMSSGRLHAEIGRFATLVNQ